MKSELFCPKGHPLTEKEVSSLNGKLRQQIYKRKVGVKKWKERLVNNLKKKNV